MGEAKAAVSIGVVGDVHGHLQLALAVMAAWQVERGQKLEAVFLCGDVGTFTPIEALDKATQNYAQKNPIELEFMLQWSTRPAAPWLGHIFLPLEEGGLGLDCPVIMVHGNHEGFGHLQGLAPQHIPKHVLSMDELPVVDTLGKIRYLPSGWQIQLPSGYRVGGVGGIDQRHRKKHVHPMAYICEAAVRRIQGSGERLDLLITHQGPAGTQGSHGSDDLQPLLDRGVARAWCHGHGVQDYGVTCSGPAGRTMVIPLEDIAFPLRGERANLPRDRGWCWLTLSQDVVTPERHPPRALAQFDRAHWLVTRDGLWVCPPLAHVAEECGIISRAYGAALQTGPLGSGGST